MRKLFGADIKLGGEALKKEWLMYGDTFQEQCVFLGLR